MKYFYLLTVSLLTLTPAFCQVQSFTNRGIGGGGALFSPAISPYNHNQIWMSCDMTELFYTQDGGQSWDFCDFRKFTAFQQSKVNFTSNPKILYALRINFRDEITYPVKSNTAGADWQALPSPNEDGLNYLFADPNRADRILVSDWRRFYISSDSGQTYEQKFDDNQGNLYIAGVYWDNDLVVAATNYGLIVSHNGGQSFAVESVGGLPSGVVIADFAAARQNGTIRFYIVTADAADIYPTVPSYEYAFSYDNVYRLDYGAGSAWQPLGNNLSGNLKFTRIGAAVNNIHTVYIAGTNTDNSFPLVYKSANDGAAWSEVFQTQGNQNITTGYCGFAGDENWWYAEAPIGFAVAADDPNQVMFTDFGFAHKSSDGGASWHQLYVQPQTENPAGADTPKNGYYQSNGLENTSAWHLCWVSPLQLFGSFTDIGGMASGDGGLTWSFERVNRDMNSTYQILKNPAAEVLYAATSSVHDLYQSTYLNDDRIDGGKGKILFSQNGGLTWNTLHDFGHPVVWMAIDPTSPDIMYASVVHSSQGGIYKTADLNEGAASTWTKLPNPPRTEGHPLSIHVLPGGNLLCSYSGRRTSNFTASSGVFFSSNGGQSWQDRSHPDMQYWTKDVVPDPADPADTWYAAVFSGWGGAANDKGGLFRTRNQGVTWTRISDHFRVESIGIHPGNPDIAYLTTEDEGLWYTSDLQADHPDFQQSEGYKFQHPLRVFFNPNNTDEVWVTSFGNGMSQGIAAPNALEDLMTSYSVELTPVPADEKATLKVTAWETTRFRIDLYAADGARKFASYEQVYPAGVSELEIPVGQLPDGLYYLRVTDGRNVKTLKMIIQ